MFKGGEKESVLEVRDGPTERAAGIGDIKKRIGVLRLEWRGREVCGRRFVGDGPGGEGRVLVVIEGGAVKCRTAALGADAHGGDAGVLGAEPVGKHIEFADRFQRRLALRLLAENAPVGSLPIDGEISSVALCSQELEVTGHTALGYVGIDVQEG